ncbi:phage virion morphogenesis protein [Maritimibacter sp. HL-12]|uniref:phage virion morphogenesis protein n=1 Tax=Maritimibacter sp. HL-12 TaxID=1162418 RepID=UPI000A0F16D0|nr:phage virion morphogenesis protein [Maritimibacter sp. HL-12]SMH35823.1 phage virion morphogenesis (putative tail completion) protein [Maritimibacter sp. HL-12]
MAGLLYAVEIQKIAAVAGRFEGLHERLPDLAFDIGQLLENSTRERIATEKEGPKGGAWPDWSGAYAATRHGGHSLLVGNNDLLTSVQNYTDGTEIHVGSPLVYAAIHHFGGAEVGSNIPARPWLGLSDDDQEEIRALVIGEIEDLLQ